MNFKTRLCNITNLNNMYSQLNCLQKRLISYIGCVQMAWQQSHVSRFPFKAFAILRHKPQKYRRGNSWFCDIFKTLQQYFIRVSEGPVKMIEPQIVAMSGEEEEEGVVIVGGLTRLCCVWLVSTDHVPFWCACTSLQTVCNCGNSSCTHMVAP